MKEVGLELSLEGWQRGGKENIFLTKGLGLRNAVHVRMYKAEDKTRKAALAGVAQWIEHRPADQSCHQFNSQSGHMPGLQARSPVGGMLEATTD